ncbi:hypothetical protein B0H10DRAFT_2034594 [Mycena sp. CBHHK59/15]|nr:hypothetical protein B0H10DRAFT_2034594 [Mycena sp. CBHHK59/15]
MSARSCSLSALDSRRRILMINDTGTFSSWHQKLWGLAIHTHLPGLPIKPFVLPAPI